MNRHTLAVIVDALTAHRATVADDLTAPDRTMRLADLDRALSEATHALDAAQDAYVATMPPPPPSGIKAPGMA